MANKEVDIKPESPEPKQIELPLDQQLRDRTKELSMTKSIVTVLQRKLNQALSVNLQLEAQREDARKSQMENTDEVS